MRKQKLYFVGDADSPKTRQYFAVSNVRSEAERMATEFKDSVVYPKMIPIREGAG